MFHIGKSILSVYRHRTSMTINRKDGLANMKHVVLITHDRRVLGFYTVFSILICSDPNLFAGYGSVIT